MPETRAFICPHCEKAATATVQGTAVRSGFDRNGNLEGPPAEWALVQCEHCGMPSLQVREDFGTGHGFDDDDPVVVYPPPRRISPDVPSALRREWDEARRCFEI